MRYHQEIITKDFEYRRCFEMPNHNTFQLRSVEALLSRHIDKSNLARYDKTIDSLIGGNFVVVDPFSRQSSWSSWTNDLNPKLNCDFNMDAINFLKFLLDKYGENFCDVALLDPPYSPRQISECYSSIGIKTNKKDTQIGSLYKECIYLMDKLLKSKGKAIRCGWSTMGFGKKRGYEMKEVLNVTHGGPHNDTLVTVEVKK